MSEKKDEMHILRMRCSAQRNELRRMNKAFDIYQRAAEHRCKYRSTIWGDVALAVVCFAVGFLVRGIL